MDIVILSLLVSFMLYALTGNEVLASMFMCVLVLVLMCATLL